MNAAAPSLNRLARFASMAIAFVLTFAALASVNGLAQGGGDVDPGAQLATHGTSAGASRG